jgi:eukaryotic-like serine/threonine-protein kinase
MQVPGYEILEEIGRGGMGVVYKARQIALDRLVALKLMLAGVYASPEEIARFRIEAQAAARLDHPNIVRIYHCDEHEGQPFFSMELIPGSGLGERTVGLPWHPPAAAQLVRTLALAIHHAHQHAVVHRDLKPSNVLLRADGTPKITDFGLAKQLDSSLDLTVTGRIVGSARYMAPEQAEGNTHAIGPATDIHALGAILYELITGRPPFDGQTLLEALGQVRWSEPVSPRAIRPEAPAALEAICLRCLRKDPARRYGTAEELAGALQRYLAEGPGDLEYAPPPPIESKPESADRSQWWRT